MSSSFFPCFPEQLPVGEGPTPLQLQQFVAGLPDRMDFLRNLCGEAETHRKQNEPCPPAVINFIIGGAIFLAQDAQGCRDFKTLYENCDAVQKPILVTNLLPHLAALSMDAIANYVVQCIIEHSHLTFSAQYVLQFFAGHLLLMSCDKFASNVVQKVVWVCGGVPAVRQLLLTELIFNPAALRLLVCDRYGNFVVQSIVESTTIAMELQLVEGCLQPLLAISPFCTNILCEVSRRHRALLGAPSRTTQGDRPAQPPSLT